MTAARAHPKHDLSTQHQERLMSTSQTSSEDNHQRPYDAMSPHIQEAEEVLGDLNTRALAFVRARPGACVLGAITLGFLIGKLASRS
ncbi:MAG: hypothetical protein RIT28_1264 [Pseudomonadota bacterium]|jgi:hypothetical protein